MASDIPNNVWNDLNQTLSILLLKNYKSFWQNEQYKDANGKVVKWQELSLDYAKYKAKKFPSQTILRQTGEMQNSFEIKYEPTQFKIYSENALASYHQEGSETLPQRPLLWKEDEVIKKEIEKYLENPSKDFQKWLKKQLK
jgi:phage gpG-like protein